MDIQKELQAVIEKSLPALEANRLRSYIEEAEKAKVQLATAIQQVESGTKTIQGLRDDLRARDAVIETQRKALETFKLREAAFKTSEDAVTLAMHRADKADGMRQATLDVVALFTKNPEIRREHWTNKTTPIFSAPMPGSTPYQSGSSTENTSAGSTDRTE